MKKLNRKGFTLVELLAVIVILAIVVGIAIPSVTSIINGSKKSGFETAVEAAGSWLTKQVQMLNVSDVGQDGDFEVVKTNSRNKSHEYTATANASLFNKLGFKADNISKISILYDTDGNVCLKVLEIPEKSQYYTVDNWTETSAGSGSYKPNNTGIVSTYGTAC